MTKKLEVSRIVQIDSALEWLWWRLYDQTPEFEYELVQLMDEEIVLKLMNLYQGRLRLI